MICTELILINTDFKALFAHSNIPERLLGKLTNHYSHNYILLTIKQIITISVYGKYFVIKILVVY